MSHCEEIVRANFNQCNLKGEDNPIKVPFGGTWKCCVITPNCFGSHNPAPSNENHRNFSKILFRNFVASSLIVKLYFSNNNIGYLVAQMIIFRFIWTFFLHELFFFIKPLQWELLFLFLFHFFLLSFKIDFSMDL